uniref:CRAL-TRIO domain-containing protein n=1 Tax=Acrobeloides nanus TaxID=290746 RepID=A0A914E145_9BILA
MLNILPQEIEQIKSLRDKVADIISPYYDTDFNLLRWLKKYNFDFNEALLNLRAHLEFRNSNWHPDKVVDGHRDHPVHKHSQITITGNAVKTPNSIVCIEQTGRIDYWGILHTFPVNEIMKALIYDYENMLKKVMEQEAETGEQTSILYIMDLSELQYNAQLLEILQGSFPAIVTFISEHYEEIIQCFVIVNAPLFMSAIWTIVSPFLPIRIKNKIKILGSNWKGEILEMAIPNVLPSSWNIPGQDPVYTE